MAQRKLPSFAIATPLGKVVVTGKALGKNRIEVTGTVLYGGFLYSLSLDYQLHDGGWYPCAGVTITGANGRAIPKREESPIIDAVNSALNSPGGVSPSFLETLEQTIWDNRSDSLEAEIERQKGYLDSAQKHYDQAVANLRSHLGVSRPGPTVLPRAFADPE